MNEVDPVVQKGKGDILQIKLLILGISRALWQGNVKFWEPADQSILKIEDLHGICGRSRGDNEDLCHSLAKGGRTTQEVSTESGK